MGTPKEQLSTCTVSQITSPLGTLWYSRLHLLLVPYSSPTLTFFSAHIHFRLEYGTNLFFSWRTGLPALTFKALETSN